jgi:hypothetical protein
MISLLDSDKIGLLYIEDIGIYQQYYLPYTRVSVTIKHEAWGGRSSRKKWGRSRGNTVTKGNILL